MADINQKYLPYEVAPSEMEGEIQLYDFMQVVTRRKVLIIACTAACLALAIFYNQITPRIYQARISIVIPPTSKSGLLSGSQLTLPGSVSPTEKNFNTEVYKINSDVIAQRALKILLSKGYFKNSNLASLRQNPETGQALAANGSVKGTRVQTAATPGSSATSETPLSTRPGSSLATRESSINATNELSGAADPFSAEAQLTNMIQRSIKVSSVKNTNVVEISATNTKPELARDIANAVANAYAKYSKERTYQLDVDSLKYLYDEIEKVRQNLLKSELALNEYLAQKKILDPELDRQLYISKRNGLDADLVDLQNDRRDAEVRIKELNRIIQRPLEEVALPEEGSIPAAKMPHFGELRTKLINAQLKRNELASIVTPMNLEYKAIESQIVMINVELREEIKKAVKALEFEIQVITNKENLFRDYISSLDENTIVKEKQSIEFLVLQRDAESYKWLYNYLLGSILVGEINAREDQAKVEISSYADTPIFPIRPRVLLNLILGGILGLMGGIGFAFVLESLDQTINKPEKIEEFSELPLLSILPHLLVEEMQQRQGLIVEHSPQDHFSEGISRLWGNLRVLMKFKDLDSLIITSALASEGKTTISANLATMAGNSLKTILLGCDFRKPSMLEVFNIDKKNAGGLNDSIGLLYQHPSDFAANELFFADLHTLIRAQRLTGTIELRDIKSEPLLFTYQNGVLHSSNIGSWKQHHQDIFIEKFLEEKPALFSEIVYDNNTVINPEESDNEMSAGLDKIAPQTLLSKILDSYAIKGGARGLWILESKRISFSPSEMIGSPGMRELIRILKLHFDLVIIDTPPSIPFADITSLSGIADNILLVARSSVVTRQTIIRCVNWLKRLNFNMVGYVFNDTQLNRDNYYYYGYYSYSQYKKSGYGKYGGYYYGEKNK